LSRSRYTLASLARREIERHERKQQIDNATGRESSKSDRSSNDRPQVARERGIVRDPGDIRLTPVGEQRHPDLQGLVSRD